MKSSGCQGLVIMSKLKHIHINIRVARGGHLRLDPFRYPLTAFNLTPGPRGTKYGVDSRVQVSVP